MVETFKQYLSEENLWEYLWRTNKGTFFRGVSEKGTGVGLGALGKGVYLTWSETMAKTFAKAASGGVSEGVVKTFKVKRGLNLVDIQDQDFAKVKEMMGFKPHEFSNTLGYANLLTLQLKKLKYDGVVSDKLAEGIVIFDKKNVTEV